MKKVFTVQNITLFISCIFASALIIYIAAANLTPFGISAYYSSNEKDKDAIILSPKDRIKEEKYNGAVVTRQIDDLIYFTTDMPFQYDKASITITFKNDSPEQKLYLGFKDQQDWHYESRLIDAPVINRLDWYYVDAFPTLFQKEKKYNSLKEFISNPPADAIIGTYELASVIENSTNGYLKDYIPSNTPTKITTPLRGSHTLYIYLNNEPFQMDIEKQDLNFYEGEDSMDVKIYKENDLVYEASAQDDGITDASGRSLNSQIINIKNPGPELPENGVYKIVIQAIGDTVIKSITTNLHKIVFEGSLFPIESKSSYPSIVANTSFTTLFTNALEISLLTYHPSSTQSAIIGDNTIDIKSEKSEYSVISLDPITKIILPKSDVIVKGLFGYFSFSREQFFEPVKLKTVPIKIEEQLSAVDYLLADYIPPVIENGWKTQNVEFDLTNAYIDRGKLSWLLKAPKLKENEKSIIIKNIEVNLQKDPMPFFRKNLH